MSFIGRFFLLVLVLSFGELYLLIQVAERISVLATLFLCVLTGVLGGGLVRYQGLQTWRDIRHSLARGQLPTLDIVSGLILIVIGTLLLTPGFITDTVAFFLLVPGLRQLAASGLLGYFKKRIRVHTATTHPHAGTNLNPEDVVIEVEAEEVDTDKHDGN
ncbi:MAG: FxsA family protein [Gammaproteobacteria bacterium]|nr:FxsA family protein [Gammaproteobacteria bacterium]